MSKDFNLEEALAALRNDHDLTGKQYLGVCVKTHQLFTLA